MPEATGPRLNYDAENDLRIANAVQLYQTEALSLAKAASLAGVSWAQMQAILVEQGVSPAWDRDLS